jgi:hypothetical protein
LNKPAPVVEEEKSLVKGKIEYYLIELVTIP